MTALRSRLITALLVLSVTPAAASARMLIYLDFDGHAEASYNGTAITVPAFTGGAASRQAILRRLQEDFAPFDVTFITSDDLPAGQLPPGIGQGYTPQDPAIRVAFGGAVGDLGTMAAGLATDPYSHNTVWVVEHSSSSRRTDAAIANTASHELGHAFGHLAARLQPWAALKLASNISHYLAKIGPNDTNPLHQASHYLVPQLKTQIMNGPLANVREIWWRDPNVAKALRLGGDPSDPNDWVWTWQDDVLSLAAVLGLRADDHADSPQNGSSMTPFTGPLPPGESRLDASGVVEMNSASWPGMCPPVPRWTGCPTEDKTYPPTGVDADNVVMAVAKDFFRFDVVNTGPSPRLRVSIDTIDLRGSAEFAGNLDVDLEVWFNSAASGWVNITSQGARGDAATDRWAEWTTTTLSVGQYAVGVKSQGAYGDLGQYTVRVRGLNGLQLAAARLVDANPGGGFDTDSLIALIERLESRADVIRLVAGLAESGIRVGPGNGDAKPWWPFRGEASRPAQTLVADAMRQTSSRRVVAQVVAWHALTKTEAYYTYRRLGDALARFEATK